MVGRISFGCMFRVVLSMDLVRFSVRFSSLGVIFLLYCEILVLKLMVIWWKCWMILLIFCWFCWSLVMQFLEWLVCRLCLWFLVKFFWWVVLWMVLSCLVVSCGIGGGFLRNFFFLGSILGCGFGLGFLLKDVSFYCWQGVIFFLGMIFVCMVFLIFQVGMLMVFCMECFKCIR